jgi:hypothetical protein
MNNNPTRGTLLLAILAVALLLGAIGLRIVRPISSNVSDPTLDALKAQRAELSEFTSLALNRSNELRAAAESRLWTPEKINAWRNSVPEGWRVQEVATTPAVFTAQRRFLLSHQAAAFHDWPAILAFVTETSERPALRLHSLVITAPQGSKRNFSQLQLLVSFTVAKVDSKPSSVATIK